MPRLELTRWTLRTRAGNVEALIGACGLLQVLEKLIGTVAPVVVAALSLTLIENTEPGAATPCESGERSWLVTITAHGVGACGPRSRLALIGGTSTCGLRITSPL
jgi:hypothetical protein